MSIVFSLQKFLFRGPGRDLQVRRFGRTVDLPDHEQLLCAVLRADDDAIRSLVVKQTLQSWAQFALLIRRESLAGLLLMKLENPGTRDLWLQHAPREVELQHLLIMAATEAANFHRMDCQLKTLNGCLQEAGIAVLWVKGTSLSRTFYSPAHVRLSSDFDLVVDASNLEKTCNVLETMGFTRIVDSPAFCPQIGCGPIAEPRDFLIQPNDQLIPCGFIAYRNCDWPIVEIKIDALERGLSMRETTRLHACAQTIFWEDMQLLTPDLLDHVLILVSQIHRDGFRGWRLFSDLHILVGRLGGEQWSELNRRIVAEEMQASSWACFHLIRERLGSQIPLEVLDFLAPRQSRLNRALLYTVPAQFVWNSNSLPMLLLNTQFTGDRRRKLTALRQMLFPNSEFLIRYYRSAGKSGLSEYAMLALHWLVVLLPAGLIRRTFGGGIKRWRVAIPRAHQQCHH